MYKRDFTKLSSEEQVIRDKYYRYLHRHGWKDLPNDLLKTFSKMYKDYPAVVYNLSMFPNNRILLDFLDGNLENSDPKSLVDQFTKVINDSSSTERDVLRCVNHNYVFFMIASIAKDYSNWGHHELYVFPEFQLGNEYQVDYLVVGSNSEGYHLMLVELENINGAITTQNGDFGTTIRKGINQVNDWREWIESNFPYLRNTFLKYKSNSSTLPEELFTYDSTRVTYAIVAGRRSDYRTRTYRLRRKLLVESRTVLIHYDNLIDLSLRMIRHHGFGGNNYITRNGVSEDYDGEDDLWYED